MIFLIKRNFDALGNKAASKKTMIGGFVFVALVLLAFSLLLLFTKPTAGPANYLFPLAYSLCARQIAEKFQMSKQAIRDSKEFEFQSNWNVFGTSIGWALVFLVIFGLWGLGTLEMESIHEEAGKEITFVPDENNGKEIAVRGWNGNEMAQILASFGKLYKEKSGGDLAPEVGPDIDGVIHVRFPHDIPGPAFLGLIYRLQYPENLDWKSHPILVVGEAVLSPDFQVSDSKMMGRDAIFYLISDSQGNVLIYAQVGNQTLTKSLDEDSWEKAADQPLPSKLEDLL